MGEGQRIAEMADESAPWRLWGPYLSERQWGTVREDYSANRDAWQYLSHEHVRSRAYRWGEDGIGGVSDDGQRLCLAVALWNGQDPILKERLFGLTNSEDNHGEDVKQLYCYHDATPTHSYLKMLYKYPQQVFPYRLLVEENRRRDRSQPEFELLDTGVFDNNRYFDVFVQYAKCSPTDLLMQIAVLNRGPQEATLDVLPQLWFRNTWSWSDGTVKPELSALSGSSILASHPSLGDYHFEVDCPRQLLFCENETNVGRVFNSGGEAKYRKDAFHDAIVLGDASATNPAGSRTKAAAHYRFTIQAGDSESIRVRLSQQIESAAFEKFDEILRARRLSDPQDPGDLDFLERLFHKLMLNFTWWMNRKDAAGRNMFQGRFLGLDNTGVFDRSKPLPMGGQISQADGTSWMAMYSLNLMRIALELAKHNPVYEDIATKFFEHFLAIAEAMANVGETGLSLWNEEDGFFYDVLDVPGEHAIPLKIRSMVGLIPLFAVETLDPDLLSAVPNFKKRLEWYLNYRSERQRLVKLFLQDETGGRPSLAHYGKFQRDRHFRDYVHFYEYFHGDTGRGVGASHQTGWTGLVAKLMQGRATD